MSTLYVVPTPIGNIKDITVRAMEVLRNVPVVLAEDTRITKKLLRLLEIDYSDRKFVSFFDYNERKKMPRIIEILEAGFDVALVSDAGTPVLSDPGFKLIRELRWKDYKFDVEVLPGATSITTALVTSGLPPDRFTFLGYFPRKPSGRKKLFKSIRRSHEHVKCTYIAFESQHRLLASLRTMRDVIGNNVAVALCRELTKKFETVETGDVGEIIDMIEREELKLKGEIVVVFNLSI